MPEHLEQPMFRAGTGNTMYENGSLSQATGGPLRPGGMDLTGRLLELCQISAGARILDIGCGAGSTVESLRIRGFRVTGLDRSELLLHSALSQYSNLSLLCGWSKSLPVASGSQDVILAECSLSAMSNRDAVLNECRRVLKPGGRLAISDVYARNPQGIPALRSLPLGCGLRDALAQDELSVEIKAHGFDILTWEDHSETLKVLAAQMILSHGSLCEFWSQAEPAADPFDLQIAMGKAKLGYYLLVAQKKQANP